MNNLLSIHVIERLPKFYYQIVNNVMTVIFFFLFLLAYRLYVRFIEKREAYEISSSRSLKELGIGWGIGFGLVAIVVGLMSVLQFYQIESLNTFDKLINAFFVFGVGAFLQELIFRGIGFRLIEELLGTWIAFIIIAFIFGFLHIFNENATIFTSLSIVLTDIILTGAFIYTRRIWLVWGIHFGWNFFQDGIFGMPNSGITKLPSWINPTVNGPEWITGGSWGIEASYIAILLCLFVGIIIVKKAWDKNLFVKPVWNRKAEAYTGKEKNK